MASQNLAEVCIVFVDKRDECPAQLPEAEQRHLTYEHQTVYHAGVLLLAREGRAVLGGRTRVSEENRKPRWHPRTAGSTERRSSDPRRHLRHAAAHASLAAGPRGAGHADRHLARRAADTARETEGRLLPLLPLV